MSIRATEVSESVSKKLLGVILDSKLNFSHHVCIKEDLEVVAASPVDTLEKDAVEETSTHQ